MCTKCDVTWLSVLASLAVGVFLIVGIICLLYVNRKFPSGALRPLLNAWQQLSVVLQFDSDWPKSLKFLATALNSINLDVPISGPVCLGIPFNFYFRLLFAVLTMIIFVAVPWLRYLFHCKRRKLTPDQLLRMYYNTLGDTVISVLIVHPPISGLAIQIFRCNTFKSPLQNLSMLVSDYSIQCNGGAWTGMAVFAVVILAFFSLGVPILFARILWRRNHKLHFNKEEQGFVDSDRAKKAAASKIGDSVGRGGGETKTPDSLASTTLSSTTVDVVDADQQQEEGLSGEMIALLEALRGDGMTAETERALIADIVKPARQLGKTGDGGGGETKTPDGDTTAGQPPPPKRIRDVVGRT